jgi:hypothetical protein
LSFGGIARDWNFRRAKGETQSEFIHKTARL